MSYKTFKIDTDLVSWLLERDIKRDVAYTYRLENGVGERIELTIINRHNIKFEFFGKVDLGEEDKS